MRCSICGGHLTNQRCDDCGMIFPPEDRYTLHHTEDPNCPSHVEPGQKARPVSLAADYARHRAESAPRPQPSQRPTKPTYQNSNSGRRKGSQIPGLIIALVWVVICLMITSQYQLRQYEINWFHCLLSLLFYFLPTKPKARRAP